MEHARSRAAACLVGPPPPAPVPATLVEAFLALQDRPGPWLHVGNPPRACTGAEIVTLARRWRRAFTAAGVARGDRVAILLPNDERFVGAFFGAMLAGAVAVPLSWPVSGVDARRKLDAGPIHTSSSRIASDERRGSASTAVAPSEAASDSAPSINRRATPRPRNAGSTSTHPTTCTPARSPSKQGSRRYSRWS